MRRVRELWARLTEMTRRGAIDRELDEELRLHRDLLIEEHQRRGRTPDEARRLATLALGGLDQGKEIVRETRGLPPLEAIGRDISHAVRLLLKSPAFSSVTVLTLALGIAVNVAIFSIVDAVVLRPLPYLDAERLVSIWETGDANRGRMTVAAGNLADYRAARGLTSVSALESQTRNLTGTGEPETLFAEQVTDNYFSVLGVTPAIGRTFTDADAQPGGPTVAIVSDALWRRRFGADPAVLGRAVMLDGTPHEIVGVMPPSFRSLFDLLSPDRRSLWVPAVYPPELLANRGDHGLRLIGRLADGVSAESARAELAAISEALAAQYPETNRDVRTGLQPLRDDLVRNVRVSLLVLLAMVGVILTIACVNVANLFLARGVGRRREVAVRFALGATRLRVATTLIAESLVLAVAAAVVGTVLAVWIQNLLLSAAPQSIPRLEAVAIDARVLAYTGVVAIATGLLFGLIPAWQTGHSRPADALAGSGRVVAGSPVMRWRNALMLGQIALSALLLVGAGLMVKSLLRLNSVSLGFDPANVLAMRMTLPESRYPTGQARLRFFESLEERVAAMPGVEAVAFANNLPLRGGWSSGFRIEGKPAPPDGYHGADFQAVSAGYFATLGITRTEGRLIERHDTTSSQPVAVVSRMFERKFLGGHSALGRQIRRGSDAPAITVVGVVEDVRRDGRTTEVEPQVYLPAAQTAIYPVRLADFAVRSETRPADFMPAIRAAVGQIDPQQAVSNVRTLEDTLLAGSADRRFQALLFSLFGVLALVLASVGTYGVVSYVVSQRTPEIGVRLALGSTVWGIYRWLLARTCLIVVTGAFIGLLAARWLGRYVSTLLFEVTVSDPASYLMAATVLVTVAVAASLVAGRRAAQIDPTQALRYE
ncbi:MAG TPA: ABC transporter permease [Vicinamibacterales bacterium]|nr:ABC transporter permease [Vicinamibacterales bacterium]